MDFIKIIEEQAAQFDGRQPDGSPVSLGTDFLVYCRLFSLEQGAIERLARSDLTLADEIADFKGSQGFVYLGNPEEIRAELKASIDAMFAAIYKVRGIPDPAQAPNVK
jgi:hypothetical protein